jgi:hypothetical protein
MAMTTQAQSAYRLLADEVSAARATASNALQVVDDLALEIVQLRAELKSALEREELWRTQYEVTQARAERRTAGEATQRAWHERHPYEERRTHPAVWGEFNNRRSPKSATRRLGRWGRRSADWPTSSTDRRKGRSAPPESEGGQTSTPFCGDVRALLTQLEWDYLESGTVLGKPTEQ